MNARLLACMNRNDKRKEEGKFDQLEPVLPRMNQFGSCFSYWPRDPNEE